MAKAKKAKAWSKTVEEVGVKIRIHEREPGGTLRIEVRDPNAPSGKRRESLGHRDRTRAEQEARAAAREIAKLRLSGHAPTGPLTLGDLIQMYLHHAGPGHTAERLRFLRTTTELLLRHLGPGFPVDDFGQHQADTYLTARRNGTLRPDYRRSVARPRDGALRNEIQAFSCICNWAIGFKANGRRLLTHNPVRDVKQPQEANPVRPRAGLGRYTELLAVADQTDPSGTFRLMLVLAWHTSRRINAICHLRRSDLLLNAAEMRRALAQAGEDETLAEAWPAAIRWPAEWDKKGYLTFSPFGTAVRKEIELYLQRHPCIGDAWLFPSSKDPAEPTNKLMAGYYLKKAEALAGLPHQKQGGWHAFRRGWATARKHLPVQDVMAAGGWRDPKALQTAYQAADAATILRVVELAGPGDDPGTDTERAGGQG